MADLAALTGAIEVGDRATAVAVTRAALEEGTDPRMILGAMTAAMDVVGGRFQQGEIFVPEMLIAARAMKEALVVLEPRRSYLFQQLRHCRCRIRSAVSSLHLGNSITGRSAAALRTGRRNWCWHLVHCQSKVGARLVEPGRIR